VKRVVAECLANGHLGIYEADMFSANGKCNQCHRRGLRSLTDEDGHKEMPLKQAQRFVLREEARREAAKNPPVEIMTEPEASVQVA